MSTNSLLDSKTEIAKIDVENVIGSIEMLGSQVQHIWELAQALKFDPSYREVTNVVVAGMGGSILGTHIIQTLFKDELQVPITIAPDYTVPHFVNSKTLVIASSYSGTTEETIAAVKDAHAKGALIAGITSGGPLAEYLQANNFSALIFTPTYNPCNSPRMALGYSIFGQMALFAQAGLLKVTQAEYEEVLETIAHSHLLMSVAVPQSENLAKLLAFEFIDRIPVITASEHLEGVAHVFANQLNENSKTFAEYRVIPEINHHLMEGLQFPAATDGVLYFLTIQSELYGKSNQKRMSLTEQVLEENHIEFKNYTLQSTSRLAQVFEFLLLSSYTSFYLAMLHGQNPRPNPWVDWFKAELKKAS